MSSPQPLAFLSPEVSQRLFTAVSKLNKSDKARLRELGIQSIENLTNETELLKASTADGMLAKINALKLDELDPGLGADLKRELKRAFQQGKGAEVLSAEYLDECYYEIHSRIHFAAIAELGAANYEKAFPDKNVFYASLEAMDKKRRAMQNASSAVAPDQPPPLPPKPSSLSARLTTAEAQRMAQQSVPVPAAKSQESLPKPMVPGQKTQAQVAKAGAPARMVAPVPLKEMMERLTVSAAEYNASHNKNPLELDIKPNKNGVVSVQDKSSQKEVFQMVEIHQGTEFRMGTEVDPRAAAISLMACPSAELESTSKNIIHTYMIASFMLKKEGKPVSLTFTPDTEAAIQKFSDADPKFKALAEQWKAEMQQPGAVEPTPSVLRLK